MGYILYMSDNQAGAVWHITVLDQVDSTQDWVRRNMPYLPDRAVVVSYTQTDGRGRLGREWESPPGGLYASVLFKPSPVPEYAPRVSLTLAAVLARSLRERGIPALVKWPNDVLVGQGKIAGILAEAGGYSAPWLIVGVGVNLLGMPAVSGRAILPVIHWGAFAKPPEAMDLLDEILDGLSELWPSVEADPLANAAVIINEALWMKGKRVRISTGKETFYGAIRGVSGDGGLVLEQEGGDKVFHSGELSTLVER